MPNLALAASSVKRAVSQREPAVAQLPGVLGGVASYVGVPVWLPGGGLFGTLCAAGSEPTEGLSEHDTGLLHVLAAILGDQIDHQRTPTRPSVPVRAAIGISSRLRPFE